MGFAVVFKQQALEACLGGILFVCLFLSEADDDAQLLCLQYLACSCNAPHSFVHSPLLLPRDKAAEQSSVLILVRWGLPTCAC